MTTKNGMVAAYTLGTKDVIEVPIESCMIVSMNRVPGQLKNRGNYLIELTVVPLSGPWQNCEGRFVIESGDFVPMVRKFKPAMFSQTRAFLCRLAGYFTKTAPKAVALPSPYPSPKTTHTSTGPLT